MKILLIHQYAGNKGDRAVLFATCRLLLSLDAETAITVSTSAPELWMEAEYQFDGRVKYIPWAWDYNRDAGILSSLPKGLRKFSFTILRESILHTQLRPAMLVNRRFRKAAREADAIISVGGHHFTTLLSSDLVSSVNFDAMGAYFARKPLYAFSQSFGPFKFRNQKNKSITSLLLRSFRKLYIRDTQSRKELLELGVPEDLITYVPETVFSLNDLFPTYVLPSERGRKVGVAIYSTVQRNARERQEYIESISELVRHVVKKEYDVIFFPMELKASSPDDRPLIREIIASAAVEKCSYIDEDMSVRKHLEAVSQCAFFVGHKTHSTIFAMATGTPLLAIAYHPKTISFLQQFGYPQDVVADEELSAARLVQMFDAIETRLDETGASHFNHAQRMSGDIKVEMMNILNDCRLS